ncbi:TonB-dependent receptor domain-containing protein [Stakelama marina]|uniref:TonB-dependent receptor n=1 Tax=Stakelama marina TaxID=2826939 RepID=A0A8T4ICY3_9SPHN|nr:TonB-dependent receptor [Stakelama marina]MBR0551714.1 TonB-dependent receptor [Stakelama marina]
MTSQLRYRIRADKLAECSINGGFMKKSIFLRSSALGTALLISVTASGTAFAQTADGSATDQSSQSTADQDQTSAEQASDATALQTQQPESDQGNALVVTGTRIRATTAFNSPDPVSIIDPEIAMKEGKLDTASMLQSSPIAAGSTQITAALSSNFVTNGGPGAQTIDLRGLGPNRTLVLLNGRRAGPAGVRGGVSSFDLNVLPQSIVSNIQILKTGASSIYGSDAIAGVVNIITKKDTNGLQLDGNVSVPFDSGGETYRLNAIWGKTFSRGHIMVAGDYSHTNELKRGDRSYLACPEAYTFRPDGSRADIVDPRTGQYKCEDLRWGHVWTYNLIDNMQLDGPGGPNTGYNTSPRGQTILMQYQYPGENLGIPAYGAPAYPGDFGAPPGWYPTGYNTQSLAVQNAYHPFVEEQTIIPKTDLYTFYADGAYEIADSVELFGEFLFNRRETYQNGWRQFWSFGYTGDLYGTGTTYNVWAPGWTGLNLISPTAITNHADSSQKVDYYRGVGGVRGDVRSGGFMDGWHWEMYGQYSRSIGRYRNERILQDVYDISTQQGFGSIGSCVGMTTPVSGKQCIDLPWTDPNFLRGELTPEQVAYIFSWEEGKTTYSQLTAEASVSGDLLTLPAGPLGVAAGLTIRRDEINDVPGAITLAGNAWGSSTSGITAGNTVTKEAFGELNIPVINDTLLFKELTLSAAGRVTNVTATRASDGFQDKNTGNYTYKLGANWALTDFLRFRASYGTSFRAPALFEQFLSDQTSFPRQTDIDPCVNYDNALAQGAITQRQRDNCAADGIPSNYNGAGVTATAISQGGVGVLSPETSKAFVVGGILTPKFGFLPQTDINIAVDYFDIRVKGEVAQLGARNIIYQCYNSLDFPNDPLCSLFTRGQTGAPYNIATVRDKYINIASQKNSGVDVTVQLRQNLGSLGRLTLLADMTWQTRDNYKLLPDSPLETDNGEAGSPRWVGDFRLSWENADRDLNIFYGMNVIGGTSNVGDFLRDNGGDPCIDSYQPDGTPIRGTYCPDLTAPAIFYHNVSITKDIGESYSITLGISNLFDTRPPRVSVLNGGEISMLGPVVAASQYSFVGRRAFLNVSTKF